MIRMLGEIRWTSENFESLNRWIVELSNLRIVESKNKYYSWNHSKMIQNLDFEIEECVVILIIIFVFASEVTIPNAIIQKGTRNWIQTFKVFIVTIFMILLDDSMSVFMVITYDSNDNNGSLRCGGSLGSRFWCYDVLMFWCLFLWFHELFSKINLFHFLSAVMFWSRWRWWRRWKW
jgi:hypothetical protein